MITLRILADENIPRSVVLWFRERKYNIIRALDVGLKGETDFALVRWALRNKRMILTLDRDFIGLYRQIDIRPGVIVVMTHPSTPQRIRELLSSSLSEFKIERYSKELIVLTDEGIRVGAH